MQLAMNPDLNMPFKPLATMLPIVSGMAFLTPIGMPPTLLVQQPGGYSFLDYMKAGGPLFLVSMVAVLTWTSYWVNCEIAWAKEEFETGSGEAKFMFGGSFQEMP